jgi:hypothetical protein
MAEQNQLPPLDEERLVNMLQKYQPPLSNRFYEKMRTAPWQHHPATLRRQALVLAAFCLLLVFLTSIFTSMPLKAVAQQLAFFFWPEPKDRLIIRTNLPTPDHPGILGPIESFTLDPSEAQSLAGFDILQISPIPTDLTLRGAYYDPDSHAVTLLYEGAGYLLYLTQRQLDETTQAYLSIGASAIVEPVQVRGVHGEYVTGGWKTANNTPQLTSEPGPQATLNVYWDPLLPKYTLLWKEGDIYYILRSLGESGPTRNELVTLAENLK